MTSPAPHSTPVPLRCHLLIGPPASGKTTLAGVLADLTGAVVLSTDVVRAEWMGAAADQRPWRPSAALLHQRARAAVAAGAPALRDATHARRPWRLAITQALSLPAPVEWIGWWLYTPLSTCLQWNQT
ncbi:MAG: AAA family ATPase, partial [Cyanobacteriota bacterium]